jgi:hypothetical protein
VAGADEGEPDGRAWCREAVAALVLGALSIPFCFLMLGGPIAVMFGIYGMVYCRRDSQLRGMELAAIGIALGLAGTLLSLGLGITWANSRYD